MTFELSPHARDEIARRAIPLYLLESVLQNPQQWFLKESEEKRINLS